MCYQTHLKYNKFEIVDFKLFSESSNKTLYDSFKFETIFLINLKINRSYGTLFLFTLESLTIILPFLFLSYNSTGGN